MTDKENILRNDANEETVLSENTQNTEPMIDSLENDEFAHQIHDAFDAVAPSEEARLRMLAALQTAASEANAKHGSDEGETGETGNGAKTDQPDAQAEPQDAYDGSRHPISSPPRVNA